MKNKVREVSHDLEWPRLQEIVVRLIGARAHLRLGDSLEKFLVEPEARDFKRVLDAAVNLKRPGCGVPLVGYLNALWCLVEPNVSAHTSHPYIKALGDEIRRNYCEICAPGSHCEGTIASQLDDRNRLAAKGECLADLMALVRFAEDLAASAYRSYVPTISLPSLDSAICSLAEPNPILQLSLSGSTTQVDGARVIKLAILESGFGWKDYVAILPVAFHEFFVHGWSGTAIIGDDAVLSESFDEGWMDLVGLELLCRSLRSLSAEEEVPRLVKLNADRFARTAEALNHSRTDSSLKHPDAPFWQLGMQAARILRHFSRQALESECLGDEVFFAFSLALNVSQFSATEREEFVTCLYGLSLPNANCLSRQKKLDLIATWAEFGQQWQSTREHGMPNMVARSVALAQRFIALRNSFAN
jgi:hypothetical protein